MTIDRRSFLYAGGMTAAATPFATAAHAAPIAAAQGRSVTDFGVEPNADRDQTEALQKAINELCGAGLTVIIPGGSYNAKQLTLPSNCAIEGTPGRTTIRVQQLSNGPAGEDATISLFGLDFRGRGDKTGGAQLAFKNTSVNIVSCTFLGESASAIQLDACSGILSGLAIGAYSTKGIAIDGSNPGPSHVAGFTISACRFTGCGVGISMSGARATIAQNHFDRCAVGIDADGSGIVSGNIVTSATKFGLKLGSAKGSGHILAQSNLIRDCRIGIGVSASGDDIMASLNMIAGAKDGAIRAFDGDKLVGPDLARQSAEAYLNLMVAGNVVR